VHEDPGAQRLLSSTRLRDVVIRVGALIAAWPARPERDWILLSVAMIVSEGFASMALFWPRNTIMFVEGLAMHPADVLRQTAEEFQRLHWLRLAFNAVG